MTPFCTLFTLLLTQVLLLTWGRLSHECSELGTGLVDWLVRVLADRDARNTSLSPRSLWSLCSNLQVQNINLLWVSSTTTCTNSKYFHEDFDGVAASMGWNPRSSLAYGRQTQNPFSLVWVYGEVMSRDVPICNILATCREVLNRENREVFHLGKSFMSNTLNWKNSRP